MQDFELVNIFFIQQNDHSYTNYWLLKIGDIQTRHGILYHSSASKSWQSICFRKMSAIFSLFCMTFHGLNALDYEEKTK